MNLKRTESSIKNLIVAFGGQFVGLLISVVTRVIFVKFLSSEYLGLNGLFTNILTMLSLVELGIGPAMAYALYEPLAKNQTEKIKSLMWLYKKAYIVIGVAVLGIGAALIPALPFIITDMPENIPHINLIYMLFVANTAVSYFYSYKRSLIISDQKRYIATIYRYGFYIALNVFQIIVLAITGNYILFLVCQILFTWLENFFVSRKADKMYPYLKEKNVEKLDQESLTSIKKNVYAMVFHKVFGGISTGAIDGLIITRFVNLVAVGIYSNYQLVTQAIHTVLSQIYNSIIASVGNLGATGDYGKMTSIFNKTNFVTFWLYGFCSISLMALFEPFVRLFFGSEYLFTQWEVLAIVIQFYLTGMRKSVLAFRDATGAYWYDRYKPIFELAFKLIFSILLAIKFGVIGVFIGTSISILLTGFWVEPYVLYKHVLHAKLSGYFVRYAGYTLLTIVTGLITLWICSFFSAESWLGLILRGIVCLIIPNAIFTLIFFRTEDFRYFIDLVRSLFAKFKQRGKQKAQERL